MTFALETTTTDGLQNRAADDRDRDIIADQLPSHIFEL
jgi:hypothetical protein